MLWKNPNLNKEEEDRKSDMEILEWKYTITEIKKPIDGINNSTEGRGFHELDVDQQNIPYEQ